MPEQAAPILVAHRHAPELGAVNARDAVVLGEPLIDEGVVRIQQLADALVFAQHALDQELGLLPQRVAQIVVEIRERRRIRLDTRDVAQEQPLPGEIRHERLRARIGEHALHLRFEHGFVLQLPALG